MLNLNQKFYIHETTFDHNVCYITPKFSLKAFAGFLLLGSLAFFAVSTLTVGSVAYYTSIVTEYREYVLGFCLLLIALAFKGIYLSKTRQLILASATIIYIICDHFELNALAGIAFSIAAVFVFIEGFLITVLILALAGHFWRFKLLGVDLVISIEEGFFTVTKIAKGEIASKENLVYKFATKDTKLISYDRIEGLEIEFNDGVQLLNLTTLMMPNSLINKRAEKQLYDTDEYMADWLNIPLQRGLAGVSKKVENSLFSI